MPEQIDTDWSVLYPGEEVNLPGIKETITVFPLGEAQLSKFSGEIEAIFFAAAGIEFKPDADPGERLIALTMAVAPVLVGRAKGLLDACCSRPIAGAPVKVLTVVAEAWIRQSFEGVDLFPIQAAIQRIIMRVTGQPSLSAYVSQISSRLGINSKTSFTNTSSPEMESSSHIPVGA